VAKLLGQSDRLGYCRLGDHQSWQSKKFPGFITAVSMLFCLAPDDALAQLERRAVDLESQLVDAERQLAGHPGLHRLFLLEEEYRERS
jgi:hypothetical protein